MAAMVNITSAIATSRTRHVAGRAKSGASSARAVAERREPHDARERRLRRRTTTARRPVLVGERADEQHGVEVDVRVEPRQREDRGEHAAA